MYLKCSCVNISMVVCEGKERGRREESTKNARRVLFFWKTAQMKKIEKKTNGLKESKAKESYVFGYVKQLKVGITEFMGN